MQALDPTPSGTPATASEATALAPAAPPGWSCSERPPSLFRRFEFASYAHTRAFLDRLAELQESNGVTAQNINFGRTYVNVTLSATGAALSPAEYALAAELGRLATA